MRFVRYVSLVDVITTVMVLFILLLPPRTMVAAWAASNARSGVTEADRYAVALSEARAISDGKDGELIAEASRRLLEVGLGDWAVETAARGSAQSEGSPSQWRALLATSVAYVERLEAIPALDYAKRALAACATARAVDERVCPSWEEVRMDLYKKHLDAGVASGIDAKKDPAGFRRAGEASLRTIHIRERQGQPATAPSPAPGAGAATPDGATSGAPAAGSAAPAP
jgi:hypothetical protein